MPRLHPLLKKSQFPFRCRFHTTWPNNDNYGRVNSGQYFVWMDTALDYFLQCHCGLVFDRRKLPVLKKLSEKPNDVIVASPFFFVEKNKKQEEILIYYDNILCFCAENNFQYFDPVSYPESIEMGVGVENIGKSSVTFRVGVFSVDDDGDEKIKSLGKYVHVFVNRNDQRPIKEMPEGLKKSLEKIQLQF